MTRIDFYVSPNQASEAHLQLACRIVEKAYGQNNRVYIYLPDPQQAKQLDDLLWVFNQGSFIPHCQQADSQQTSSPVLIGEGDPPEQQQDVLINLGNNVPNFFSRFERVVEIVSGDENTRNLARNRFKFYRERGYPLESHELNR